MSLEFDNRRKEYEEEIKKLGQEKTNLIIEIEKKREELKAVEDKKEEVIKKISNAKEIIKNEIDD